MKRDLTVWTCDECGTIEEGPLNTKPIRWRLVRVNLLSGGPEKIVHLCFACSGKYGRILR
jgi:hypothetical protein